ncbi:type III-B CRISPR module-associated protein Cmr5 [Polyangium mundeleinium]|uniref:CRISPR type III-B/RAMP module-associated protein Cmr5 n=1 Tax=Polyangium mundeleinium TaxID=2995306 RepID=A0ABT5EI51_9BACT|nr:type III-B CRISPR module-associated protein Cmr5 [Polyangium mundeleinium]MDC0741485.1 type III-B CRISPR module-associated protein Cmr5 [Polyangium mundeleinium]
MPRTRDQERALHAYARVKAAVEAGLKDEYKVLVHGLAPTVQRNGLAAAISFIEREKPRTKAAGRFLDDLAAASLPHLDGRKGDTLPGDIRGLQVPEYMLVTREVLKLAIWFRRAVQATIPERK